MKNIQFFYEKLKKMLASAGKLCYTNLCFEKDGPLFYNKGKIRTSREGGGNTNGYY